MSDAFGSLFEISEAGTTINIPTAGTFVKWVTASAGPGGPTDLLQVDAANNQLVVGANGAGTYKIDSSCSFDGNNNSLKQGAIFLNGVRQQRIEFNRQIGAAMDQGNATLSGILALVAADVIDIRFTADSNGDTVVLRHINLIAFSLIRTIAP